MEHLDLYRDEWAEVAQLYRMMYTLIRDYTREANIEFYDFTDVLDQDKYIYIDFCHVSPNGNKLVAQTIVDVIGLPPRK